MENLQETVVQRFIIGDTETAGLPPHKKACEVGLIEIDPVTLDVRQTWSSLIDPLIPITPGASAIHGITDAMVAREPTMAEFVTRDLGGGLSGQIALICHNVPFDKELLEPIGYVSHTLCTLFESRQVRHLMPGLENCKLQTLREYFGIPANSAHRALDDCYVTLAVLKELVRLTGRTVEDLAKAQVRDVHVMPWGKFVGQSIATLPRWYLKDRLALPDLESNLRRSLENALAMAA